MCNILEKQVELEKWDSESLGESADGSVIFGQNRKSGSIKIWDSRTGRLVRILNAEGDSFALGGRIVVSENGRVIAARLKNRKTIFIGDTFTGHKSSEFATTPFGESYKTYLSPDGKILLTGEYNRGAALWDVMQGRLIGILSHPSQQYAPGETLPFLKAVFSPDSKIVATAFWGYIYLWDTHSAKFLKRLYHIEELGSKPFGYQTFIYDLEFSPDGSLLAAGSRDGQTQLWEVESGDVRAGLDQGDRVFSVTFSTDARFLATVGYDDKNIKVWETSSGRLLYMVKGISPRPYNITFSEPEIGLVAVLVKNGVEFRDMATGNLVQKCNGTFGYFLPDGETFAAGLKPTGFGLFTVSATIKEKR